ncbi:hypothetical protein R83H12_02014 [Fibrobacteria bacterium R8-3-H12]
MTDELKVEDVRKSLSSVKEIDYTPANNYDGTYLFFSFDLVNSTSFKNTVKRWGKIFDGFIKQSKKLMEEAFPSARIWKMIGDEILFYLQVNSPEVLYEAPEKSFGILQKCIEFINNEPEVKSNLSVKATIWAAVVNDSEEKDTERNTNIIVKDRNFYEYLFDFLGPDIDIGFRISKFAKSSVLVIEAKLACLITKLETEMEKEHISEYMRIVSYEELKGVWNGRRYPIVWYRTDWSYSKDMFIYDEKYKDDIVRRIEDTEGKCLDSVSRLTKIFSDLNKLDTIKKLKTEINQEANLKPELNIPKDRLCEMHIVAICINSKKEILVAKRTKKSTLSEKWEFGCSQLHFNQDFIDAINEGYKNDFGIKVEFLGENPIAVYHFKKEKENERLVPGVIFLCKITEGENSIKQDTKNHSEYKFVNKENYKEIPETDAVPDFYKRIEGVYEILNSNLSSLS